MKKSQQGPHNTHWKGGVSKNKSEYLRAYRTQNMEKIRAQRYKARFGITLAEYNQLFLEQKGVCAICKQECRRGKLCVDHDHETGAVRGLLCRSCNAILGLISDNPLWLKNAGDYLASAQSSTKGLPRNTLWSPLDEKAWICEQGETA